MIADSPTQRGDDVHEAGVGLMLAHHAILLGVFNN